MSDEKPKKLTLSDEDITLKRKQPAAASLTNVGGGPGAAGKHVGTDPAAGAPSPRKPAPSDPDAGAPGPRKPAPSDPDGH